jgi:hypothetical protein
MADEAQLGFLARTLAEQPGILVRRRGVRVVGAGLAMEVALAVAPRRRRLARAILRPEALQAGPRLQQRAVVVLPVLDRPTLLLTQDRDDLLFREPRWP